MNRAERGFALLVTLSLMILLVVIGVGMLTLASISLRTSGTDGAVAKARANARMALMMALGDLQKNAGPDQRVTARADIDPDNDPSKADPKIGGMSKIAGVWQSRKFDPSNLPAAGDYNKQARDDKFLGWLISSANGKDSRDVKYARTSLTADKSVILWGKGSLGIKPPATSPRAEDIVSAAKLPMKAAAGSLAWAVMDEGVKVRIDTPYVEQANTKGRQTAQLGSGVRPNTEAIPTLGDLKNGFFEEGAPEYVTIEKGISRLNFDLVARTLASGTEEKLKLLSHDVTPSSVGLFTDVADGGLKEDMNILTNPASLPVAYDRKGIYASRLGLPASSVPSDPRWESLRDFARLYRDTSKLQASGGAPLLKAQAPVGWSAAGSTGAGANPNPPPGAVLLPVIAKVQVVFSLVGRDLYGNLPAGQIRRQLTSNEKSKGIHDPQDAHFRNTRFDYDLHLMYTPVVTLYNPYNVTMQFDRMRVEFVNVPFSMKIYRNGVAQSSDFVNLDSMYGDNGGGAIDKVFGMEIKNKSATGKVGTSSVKLLPGEVKMFSPYIDPSLTYLSQVTNRGSSTFWDINIANGSSKTIAMESIPGWRADGVGYDCDYVAGGYALDGEAANGRWASCLGLAWDDKIAVEYQPTSMGLTKKNTKFMVKMSAAIGTSTTTSIVSALEMNYEEPEGLKKFLTSNGAQFPMRYPKSDATPNYVMGCELVDRASIPIKDLANVKPFAVLSMQAKTTSGGRDISNEDGRLATKPWAFAHGSVGGSSQMILSQHSANYSHEIDLVPLKGTTNDFFNLDAQDRSSFISGFTSFNGIKFGSQYDVPIAPLQTLVGLNGANPGGSSGYLPRFAQPIGNSWAHPLLDPGSVTSAGPGYSLLDHSFLLNAALYDHFYFSGFADRNGATFDSGPPAVSGAESVVNQFVSGAKLVDPRVTLNLPDGRPSNELEVVAGGPKGYAEVAAWQVMNGAFNVNSTSVTAWKAMLGSIRDSKSLINRVNKTNGTSVLAALSATNNSNHEARISRFRLPASESEADGATPSDGYWLGPREYSDGDLEVLAGKIVEQVRERGPFLSMSDFVNRQLGSMSNDLAQCGALQQAIDESGLNNRLAGDANAGFEIGQSQVGNYRYANPRAGAGSSYQGAPGYLSQADILAVLGNAATARSDTFTIRAYGDSQDAAGKVLATAMCEAVVQRMPDYVDGADPAETAPANLNSPTNKSFGRRFNVVSFRWLSPDEI